MSLKKFFFREFKFYSIFLISLMLTACGGGGGDNDNTKTSRTSSSIIITSSVVSSLASSSSSEIITSSSISSNDSSESSNSSVTISASSSVVIADTSPPVVSIAANPTDITIASALTLTAEAHDNVGVIKVEFYDGSSLINTDLTAPYTHTINVTATNNGTKTFKAVAYDAAGNGTATAGLLVNIDIDTAPPTSVNLTSSSNNIVAAGDFTLTTTAYDNKAVTRVEFYDGATLLGSDTAAPFTYSIAVTGTNNGTKSYTAKAFDAANNSTISNAVSVTVNIDTTAPTVSLASSSTNVTAAGSITLTATASDTGSGVTKVEFYDGNTLLNTDTSSPFAHTINFNTNFTGNKNYFAKAYDAAANVKTSNVVTVNISVNIDNIAPTVVSALPANNSLEVAPSTPLTITFSEAMKTDSVTGTLIVSDYPNGANPTSQTFTAAFSSDSKVATLSVAGGFQRGKVYQFDINAADLSGNLMAATYPLSISMEQIFAGIYTGRNASGSTTVKSAVEYYPHDATGTPTPTRTLTGANTLINDWKSLVIDSKGNQYISVPGAIVIFKAWDEGNVAPRRQIAGSNTGLTTPTALALNADETELFVLDYANSCVSVFATTASGNVVPTRTLTGGINNVKDIVLHQNEIFVLGGISSAPKIWVFNQSDNGLAPKRVIDVVVASGQPDINFLNAYDGKLAVHGNVTMNFAAVRTLATSTNGSGSFVVERHFGDLTTTHPGSIAPPMMRIASSQLWINYYGSIYKLDDDFSTVDNGSVTPKFKTTGNNTPFIFVSP